MGEELTTTRNLSGGLKMEIQPAQSWANLMLHVPVSGISTHIPQ